MITQCGTKKDGKLLGEDETGKLYIGQRKLVGFDFLKLTVEDGEARYTYGDFLHGKGPAEEGKADGEYPVEKVIMQVPNIVDGELVGYNSIERKVEVVDWVAL